MQSLEGISHIGRNMATSEMNPLGAPEPELNLLLPKESLDQPLWKSLFQGLDEVATSQIVGGSERSDRKKNFR